MEQVPSGARPVARTLVIDTDERLLLLDAREESSGHRWWVTPGGGLESGEDFEQAAQRELLEETGLSLPIGPWVWTRRHVFDWEEQTLDQYERFFVARATVGSVCAPIRSDSYVAGHRWWSLTEVEASDDDFAPRLLAFLLPPILKGDYPAEAIDCGV